MSTIENKMTDLKITKTTPATLPENSLKEFERLFRSAIKTDHEGNELNLSGTAMVTPENGIILYSASIVVKNEIFHRDLSRIKSYYQPLVFTGFRLRFVEGICANLATQEKPLLRLQLKYASSSN